jgi:hypothetical protein
LFDFDGLFASIDCDICIYRQQDGALWHRYGKIFKKTNSISNSTNTLSIFKNRIVQNSKPDGPVFTTSSFGLQFLLFWCLDVFFTFSMLQIPLSFKFPRVASFFDFALKQLKQISFVQFFQRCQIWSSTHVPCHLVKLAHFRTNLNYVWCPSCFIDHFCDKGNNHIIGHSLTYVSCQTLG